MDRTQKEALVASLHQVFEETNVVVVSHFTGLTVAEMVDLRDRMRGADASFKVTKNNLTCLALKGTSYENLEDLFSGPTAISYSSDPVAAAKVTAEFAKKNDKLVILGGAIGDEKLDADGIKALAALPSLDESRANLVGLLNAPATKIAVVLQAPASQIAQVLCAYGERGEAA